MMNEHKIKSFKDIKKSQSGETEGGLDERLDIIKNSFQKFQSKKLSDDELTYLIMTEPCFPVVEVKDKYYLTVINSENFKGMVWLMDWFEIVSVYKDRNNICHIKLKFLDEIIDVNYSAFYPKNITEISDYGIVINTDYSKVISKYIYKKLGKLGIEKLSGDIGFVKKDGQLTFNAYDNNSPILQYTPDIPFESYIDGLNKLLTNGAVMFALCCGTASLFLAYLIMKCGVIIDRFVISFVGKSTKGKSTVQTMIAAIYSSITDETIFTPAIGTPSSLLRRAANKYGVTLVLDEITAVKGVDMENLIYTISMGHDKYRCSSNGSLRNNDEFVTLVITSSENRLLDKSRMHNKGLDARCLSFENLQYTDSREHSEQIKEFCNKYYGILGKKLSDYLVDAEANIILERYNSCRDTLRAAIGTAMMFDISERLINEYALILLSAVVMEDFGIKINVNEVTDIIVANHNEISENSNIGEKYYNYIMSYVASNSLSASIIVEHDSGTVSIIDIEFVKIITRYGTADIDLVVSELDRCGYLIRSKDGRPKNRRRFNGELASCYKLKLPVESEEENAAKEGTLEYIMNNFEGLDDNDC